MTILFSVLSINTRSLNVVFQIPRLKKILQKTYRNRQIVNFFSRLGERFLPFPRTAFTLRRTGFYNSRKRFLPFPRTVSTLPFPGRVSAITGKFVLVKPTQKNSFMKNGLKKPWCIVEARKEKKKMPKRKDH